MAAKGIRRPMIDAMVPPMSGPVPIPRHITLVVSPYAMPTFSRGIVFDTRTYIDGNIPPTANPNKHRSKKRTIRLFAKDCGMEINPAETSENKRILLCPNLSPSFPKIKAEIPANKNVTDTNIPVNVEDFEVLPERFSMKSGRMGMIM